MLRKPKSKCNAKPKPFDIPASALYPPGTAHVRHYLHASQAARFRAMKKLGLVLFDCRNPHLLTLDIDLGAMSAEMFSNMEKGLPPINNLDKLTKVVDTGHPISHTVTQSKSGGMHVYLYFPYPQLIETRATLAAWLGSDPIRECLSMRRWLKGEAYPWVMAETLDFAEQLETWANSISLGRGNLLPRITDEEIERMLE